MTTQSGEIPREPLSEIAEKPVSEFPRKPLRLWPAIIAVALQWIFRIGVKAVVPGITGFGYAVMGSLAFALVLIVWWAFFSRARWRERLSALALIVAALGLTWLLKHDSMWLPWLFAYAIPILSLAFVVWAVATSRLSNRVRHATMVATILIACFGWLLVRQDGINGDHVATFGWRWRASSEERLLAQTGEEQTSTPASATATPLTPATAASPSPSTTPAKQTATTTGPATEKRAEWPGFRGPRRDGVVRG